MPFVVGILRSELNEVLSLPMDEVLIIDIDKNDFLLFPGETVTDDLTLIPPNYTTTLRKVLRNCAKTVKSKKIIVIFYFLFTYFNNQNNKKEEKKRNMMNQH